MLKFFFVLPFMVFMTFTQSYTQAGSPEDSIWTETKGELYKLSCNSQDVSLQITNASFVDIQDKTETLEAKKYTGSWLVQKTFIKKYTAQRNNKVKLIRLKAISLKYPWGQEYVLLDLELEQKYLKIKSINSTLLWDLQCQTFKFHAEGEPTPLDKFY